MKTRVHLVPNGRTLYLSPSVTPQGKADLRVLQASGILRLAVTGYVG